MDDLMEQIKWNSITAMVCSFFALVFILGCIAAGVTIAHQNNIKTTKFAVTCMQNGKVFRENANGTVSCDR